jgi:type I restriction enzyme S subunit
MTSWKEYKLSDIVSVKHGFAFKGEYFSDEPTADILLTPGNINIGGGFKSSKFKYYDGDYPKEYVLKENDVIVTMTDLSKEGDTLGYSAKIPALKGARFLHNQRLGLVQPKSNKFDLNFIYWLMRTPGYQQFIVSSATGTTVKHTSPSRICEFTFRAPELPIQTAIAKILSSLDDKIELNNQINKNLEALAQALFKQWFVDFEFPISKPEAKAMGNTKREGKPYKSSGGEMVESQLGMVPKGWRVTNLDEVVIVKGGTTPSTKEPAYWDGEFHWTSPKDLSSVEFPVLLDTEKSITREGLAQIGSGLLPKGTLLLSSRAPIGYLAITEIETAINQGYIAMNAKAGFSNLFMLFWLRTNMSEVIARANGSTFLEISKSNFREIDILLPSEILFEDFLTVADVNFQHIISNQRETATLKSLRDQLLPKLISGEIQISA